MSIFFKKICLIVAEIKLSNSAATLADPAQQNFTLRVQVVGNRSQSC
ncbi:hypothetical protein AW67_10160 [Salmonella enterica subsp. enterica serovar Montevideo str. USDA-ARS-USMARC-1903]|nr:hypothetical protein AW67_10160 [Salmonella enterica subsp. enterica serovar Montevideo str. USDA-ARS-USMARC-1903]